MRTALVIGKSRILNAVISLACLVSSVSGFGQNNSNSFDNFNLDNASANNNSFSNFENDSDLSSENNVSENNEASNDNYINESTAEFDDFGVENGSAENFAPDEPDPFAVNSNSSGAPAISGPSPVVADPLSGVGSSFATDDFDKDLRTFNSTLKKQLLSRLERDLKLYCLGYCSILSFDVESSEVFDAVTPDLGFENSSRAERSFAPQKVVADVLVDVRYGQQNTERLRKLMDSLTRTYPHPITINYSMIELPETDDSAKSIAEVRSQFVRRITDQLSRVQRDFCPDECAVSDVQVQVEQASIDDISSGSLSRYIFARGARGAVYVKGVEATLTINADMSRERSKKIEDLFREVMKPFGAVNLTVRQISFPISATEIERNRQAEAEDPYGLERLRRMLEIFKEFAGTKEIVRETNRFEQTSSSQTSVNETSLESSSSSNTENSSSTQNSESSEISKSALEDRTSQTGILGLSPTMLYIVGGILLLLLIIGIFGLRYIVTGKRVQAIVSEGIAGGNQNISQSPDGTPVVYSGAVSGPSGFVTAAPSLQGEASETFVRRLESQRIKDELTEIFLRQPKVAREVFSRILKEDGVSYAAKCVSVFGEIVTYELLEDSELKDLVASLAEYVHRNVPRLNAAEEHELLESLKLRVSAGKIKVMSDKGLGSFDFLKSRSARQIYNLIADENPQSQAVVLTQMGKSKRNAIFDLFEGESKIDLLRALCQGRAVANEYLLSLSDALRRKAQRSGIFEQGLTTGVDVLLDLLAQSSLDEQQNLMAELDGTNPEAARMVRSSLVTPETLQFVRDGLLIEIFLGLEPQTLATFLAGCREHIRNMALSKVPPDMAQDWFDIISTIPSIDPEIYKVAELQVLQKVRTFSESGMINLLEINESIFPPQRSNQGGQNSGPMRRRFKISQGIAV